MPHEIKKEKLKIGGNSLLKNQPTCIIHRINSLSAKQLCHVVSPRKDNNTNRNMHLNVETYITSAVWRNP